MPRQDVTCIRGAHKVNMPPQTSFIFAVFPNICSLSLAAFSDEKEWESKIKFWENVYGKKFAVLHVVLYSALVSVITINRFSHELHEG